MSAWGSCCRGHKDVDLMLEDRICVRACNSNAVGPCEGCQNHGKLGGLIMCCMLAAMPMNVEIHEAAMPCLRC